MNMKDSHKVFLQCLMAKGILSAQEVKKQYKHAVLRNNEVYDDNNLAEFVITINANIKPLHLEIRKVICEDTGKNFYGLVNTSESDITRLASDYTVSELEFFKKVIEKVVEDETGTLSSIEALNLTASLERRMSQDDAQDLLGKLERGKWLTRLESGKYALSPRSILELEQYMREQYQDMVVSCNMCKVICLQGQCCSVCDIKLHTHCAARYFSQTSDKRCPEKTCDTPWPHAVPATSSQRDRSQASQVDPCQKASTQRSPAKVGARPVRSKRV